MVLYVGLSAVAPVTEFPTLSARHRRLTAIALALSLGMACGTAPDADSGGDDRPNVILIAIDTLRADHLTAYGYERPTSPAVASFAERGVVFERAYSQAPWTLPSFASIFTGLRPARHGVVHADDALNAEAPTLTRRLQEAGYTTAGFHDGGYLSRGFGFHHHFDSYRQILGLRSMPDVVRWLKNQRRSPFFLFLHTYDVHSPYGSVPESYWSTFASENGQSQFDLVHKKPAEIRLELKKNPFSAADYQAMKDLYDGEIRFVDDRLENLFQTLDETGLDERTYVIVLSDHGEEFGDHYRYEHHNGNLFRELSHVPLVFVGPGVAAARRVSEVVETVDVMPTVLELAGLEVGNVDGESLVPWLRPDQELRPRASSYAVSQTHDHGGARALRTRDWALVQGSRVGWRLFDLRSDWDEMHDVKDQHPKVFARLQEVLIELTAPSVGEGTSTQAAPDQETLDRLRALGYLE